ncbi:hypothetical protein [Tardiphaga sp. 803_E3_N1_3]|uniref:hypothetical protein n=1 Tax=Tardiphaga sp. 803_E3_N1_3 TaxID=3240785 RepID=UPI003F22C01D
MVKLLTNENAKLKKLLAEAMLDNTMLKDRNSKKMVTPVAKRQAVAHLCVRFEVSRRQACAVIGVDRTSVRYRSVRPRSACHRSQDPCADDRRHLQASLRPSIPASAIEARMSC